MVLGGIFMMLMGVELVTMCHVSVVCCFVIFASHMVFVRFSVVVCCSFQMLGCVFVMTVFAHGSLL
jgi:hypothetical protein